MFRKGALSLISASLFVAAAHAGTILPPGGAVLMPDEEYLTGAGVLDTRVESFAIVNALGETKATGTVISQVQVDASGFLTFLGVVINDASSLDPIARLSLTDFGGFTTEVAQDFINGYGPRYITSADRSSAGGTIGFNFTESPLGRGTLAPGEASMVWWIRTNATQYKDGTVSVINGGVDTVLGFAPAVPEPASIAALAVGAAALLRRRRK